VHPAKAAGRNEVSFGKDACVASGNTVLDKGPGPPTWKGRFGVGTRSSQWCRLYGQITGHAMSKESFHVFYFKNAYFNA